MNEHMVMPLPGVQRNEQETLPPEVQMELLNRSTKQAVIGSKEVQRAAEILKKYKDGKQNFESRIVDDELWWQLRHWESIGSKDGKKKERVEPTSAWLFNTIINKHADAMDNMPDCTAMPREQSDKESAKVLSEVLPVILEYNGFEKVYSNNWWEKLKHGTAAYGVFWNPQKENGLGDVDIQSIDLLKLFWEPGVSDIQKSRNLFIIELCDDDVLEEEFPQLHGKLHGSRTVDVKEYLYTENIDTSEKSVVVDWYYKVRTPSGRTVLHYCKFVGDEVLYASENDEKYAQTGLYEHGLYPVVLDTLFPEKGMPVGVGFVAVCKDPQLYIDKLSGNILESSMMNTKKRFFASKNLNINMDDFMDWNKPIVPVEGSISPDRLQEIICRPLDGIYVTVLQQKIEEMKDTAANRDVNSGGAGSGVTAAAAISALQEAGNKVSRDMISRSYVAYEDIIKLVIENIRQFYDEVRSFRILAPNGAADALGAQDGFSFVDLSNEKLKDQVIGQDEFGNDMFRKPVFDIKVKAMRKNPFSRMEQNETAKELFRLGVFNPELAQQAMMLLDMMEFEGIDEVREKVQQGQTLLNLYKQTQQQLVQLAALYATATGNVPPVMGMQQPSSVPQADDAGGSAQTMTDSVMRARQPMSDYAQRLVERSAPNIEG